MDRPDTFVKVDSITGADALAHLSCADAFNQRDNPLVLFTPALLFTRGGFDRDPVIEFDARFPAASSDMRPFAVDLARDHERFFSGFGIMPAPGRQRVVNWDKRIYAIDYRRQEECFEFLGGIAYSNPKAQWFANSFLHAVTIPDPTSKTGQVLEIHVVGIMSNKFVVYVDEQPNAPAVVRQLSTNKLHMLPRAVYRAGAMSGFNGVDPLDTKD
jgi:hypothetical protein